MTEVEFVRGLFIITTGHDATRRGTIVSQPVGDSRAQSEQRRQASSKWVAGKQLVGDRDPALGTFGRPEASRPLYTSLNYYKRLYWTIFAISTQ
jgi:hypothetical protein